MNLSQVLTTAALLLFLLGNYLYIYIPASVDETPEITSHSEPLTKDQALQAMRAVRHLQSEMATTNALLDRPVTSWKTDQSVIGMNLRGNALPQAVGELNEELKAQTSVIATRLSAIDKDLLNYNERIKRLQPLKTNPKPIIPKEDPPQIIVGSSEPFQKEKEHKKEPISTPIVVNDQIKKIPTLGADSPLLMICFQRADYLERSLMAIKSNHPGNGGVPVIISQDGDNAAVIRVIDGFKKTMAAFDSSVSVVHMRHKQGGGDGYHKLAQHYGWALQQVFTKLHTTLAPSLPPAARVLILEEDLEVAPDFFDFFAAMVPLLDDPTENLLAVSAWNDNGQTQHVLDNKAVYRSSFFPGLGWMMNRRIWSELSPKWPQGYWDDWLREPAQQGGREILRPEVCRTYHFATKGVSNNQYSDFLTQIKLNKDPVPWRDLDLSYLKRSAYNQALRKELSDAPLVSVTDARAGRFPIGTGPVRVEYASVSRFEATARKLGIMDNIKAGVPRCAYHGVVSVRLGQTKRLVYVSLPLQNIDI